MTDGRQYLDAVAAALGFLRRCQRADGGWGYHDRNRTSFVEPTAWAVHALQEAAGEAANVGPALDRGTDFLRGHQNDDGGWANVPGMPSDSMTARAVFALAARPDCRVAVERGASWLAREEQPGGGWGWCHGTTGFVETAAYAVVALAVAARLDDGGRLDDYLRGLQCVDGGWGSHVPRKVGIEQRSQLSVTPLGVVALVRLGRRPESDSDLRTAVDLVAKRAARGDVTTAYSLATTLWALREVGRVGEPAHAAGRRGVSRMRPDGSWGGSVLHTAMMCGGLRWLASAT